MLQNLQEKCEKYKGSSDAQRVASNLRQEKVWKLLLINTPGSSSLTFRADSDDGALPLANAPSRVCGPQTSQTLPCFNVMSDVPQQIIGERVEELKVMLRRIMGFWKAGEVTQTLPVPLLRWLINQLSLRLRREPCRVHNPRPRTHPLGICLFFWVFLYLLFISHRSASHRSKGVAAKGEQLPGNCVLLGKGSLMAPAGAALWVLACACREMQPCTCGFRVPLPYLRVGNPDRVCWQWKCLCICEHARSPDTCSMFFSSQTSWTAWWVQLTKRFSWAPLI